MGIFSVQVLLKLKGSVSVQTLYSCIASALGFDSAVSLIDEFSDNQTLCTQSGINMNGTGCANDTYYHPCSTIYTEFGPIFASLSYLVLLISTIQLILVMVHDSLQDHKYYISRWKKTFRFTIQKCLLGAVILATGSRAIYYTVQSLIPDKWGDILLNIYYPSLLSAFSLLICFWAEFFYTSSNLEGEDFLKKHKYSFTYLIFNVLVYLFLVANIIATPLISDQEQIQLSGIMGIIFAFFLFVTLVGFLHFAIRLFFRPDLQPLFVELAILRINSWQQFASVLGIVSNALMQALIIVLLVFNMVVRYIPVDSYNLYVCAIVIRVTELIMPIWFCCSLWNFKEPKRLWILNPGLILKQDLMVDNTETQPFVVKAHSPNSSTEYGTVSNGGLVDESDGKCESVDEGHCCWVCLGNDDPSDLFYPCNCRLHKKCIQQWVAKRASNVNIPEKEYMRCQLCRKKYRLARQNYTCLAQGMQRSHRLQILAAGGVVLFSVVGLALFGHFAPLDDKKKILTICAVAMFEAVIIKILGVRIALVLRKANHGKLEFKGYTVNEWRKRQKNKSLVQKGFHSSERESLGSSGWSGEGDAIVVYNGGSNGGACGGDNESNNASVDILVASVHMDSSSIVNV